MKNYLTKVYILIALFLSTTALLSQPAFPSDVIPFFDRGLPTEYELTRSIRVVARTKRKKVGVLNTQVSLFGGFDFNTFRSKPAWPVVAELEKQYDVVQIAATDSITEELDGLLVALPSSMPQEEMNHLQDYIEAGNPTLLLVDPLPVMDIGLSPSEESGANVNPFMKSRGPQPKAKAENGCLHSRCDRVSRDATSPLLWSHTR